MASVSYHNLYEGTSAAAQASMCSFSQGDLVRPTLFPVPGKGGSCEGVAVNTVSNSYFLGSHFDDPEFEMNLDDFTV